MYRVITARANPWDNMDRSASPKIKVEETREIEKCFRVAGIDVLSAVYDTDMEDGMIIHLFTVECDNTNSMCLGTLKRYLDRLEEKLDLGYETYENDHGFYGRTYSFYHYWD